MLRCSRQQQQRLLSNTLLTKLRRRMQTAASSKWIQALVGCSTCVFFLSLQIAAWLLVVGGSGIGGYFVYGIGAQMKDMIPGFARSLMLTGHNWSHAQEYDRGMFGPTALPLHLENVPLKLLSGSFPKNASAGGAVVLAKSMADLEPIRSAHDCGGVAAVIIIMPKAKACPSEKRALSEKLPVPMLIIREEIPGLGIEHDDDPEKQADFEKVGAGFCRDACHDRPTPLVTMSCVDFEACQQRCNALACQGMAWSPNPSINAQGCKQRGLPHCVVYHGSGASAVTFEHTCMKRLWLEYTCMKRLRLTSAYAFEYYYEEYTCMKRLGSLKSTDSVVKVLHFGSIVEVVVMFICIHLFMSASIKVNSFLLRLHHDCSRAHKVFVRNDAFIYCLVSNTPAAFALGASFACILRYENSFRQLFTSFEGNPFGHIFHALMETAKIENPIISSLVAIFFASILVFAIGLCWCLFWRRVCRTCTKVSVKILSVPTPATINGNIDAIHLEQNTHAKFVAETHSFKPGEFIQVFGVRCSRDSRVLLRDSGHRIILVPDEQSLVIRFNVQDCNVQLEENPRIELLVSWLAMGCCGWTGGSRPFGLWLTVMGCSFLILIPIVLACASYTSTDPLLIIGIVFGAATLLVRIGGCCCCSSCSRRLRQLSGRCRSCFGTATLSSTQRPQASIIGRDEDEAPPMIATDADVEVLADPNENSDADVEVLADPNGNHDGIDIRYLVLCPEVRRHVREQMHEDAHGYEAFFFDGFPRPVLHPAAIDRNTGERILEINAEQWSRSCMDCTDIEMTMRPWDGAIIMFNLLYVQAGLSASNFWLRKSAPLAHLNRQYINRRNEARIIPAGSCQLVQPRHSGTQPTPNLNVDGGHDEVLGRRQPIAGHQESEPEPESRLLTTVDLEAARQEVEPQEISHQEAIADDHVELVVSRTFYNLEPRRVSARRSRSVPCQQELNDMQQPQQQQLVDMQQMQQPMQMGRMQQMMQPQQPQLGATMVGATGDMDMMSMMQQQQQLQQLQQQQQFQQQQQLQQQQ